jgi:hypothetical protein
MYGNALTINTPGRIRGEVRRSDGMAPDLTILSTGSGGVEDTSPFLESHG